MTSRILILDCGSQFTQLIARRVREAHVYCEIHPAGKPLQWVKDWQPTGIILSGGPSSVTDEGAPTFDKTILDLAPVLKLMADRKVQKVFHAASNSGPLYSENCAPICQGPGKM